MRLWHFTSTVHLPLILKARHLRPTESNLSLRVEHAGPDCVWFLDGPELSPGGDGLEGSGVDKTQVRFEVDVPDARVVPWLPWAQAQAMDPVWLDILVEAGGGYEAARRWMAVFRSVPVEQWVRVEVRDDDEVWHDIIELPPRRGSTP